MKKIKPETLEIENPALFKEIKKVYKYLLPNISACISKVLEKEEPGSVADYSTFLRIVEEETDEIIHIELQMKFVRLPMFGDFNPFENSVISKISKIIIFDSAEDYKAARKKVKESIHYFGNVDQETINRLNRMYDGDE